MLRVFVALGKQDPKIKKMEEDTQAVAKLLAKYNCTMVQGGARVGLMGVVLNEFQKYSDQLVLIVPEVHKSDLEGIKNKENYIVEGEADRLKITIKTCDLIVVLPGGTGTLAELSFYNETKKSGEHSARIVMVNTKGFYNNLIKFINHQVKCGFMKREHFKYDIINNAMQLESIIQEEITKKQHELQQKELEEKKKAKTTSSKATKTIKSTKTNQSSKLTKSAAKKSVKTTTSKPAAKSSKPVSKPIAKGIDSKTKKTETKTASGAKKITTKKTIKK